MCACVQRQLPARCGLTFGRADLQDNMITNSSPATFDLAQLCMLDVVKTGAAAT
jgi:hypothetical protein